VSRTIGATYPDGSSVTIEPGAPVKWPKGKGKKVIVEELGIEVAAERESIGIAYKPSTRASSGFAKLTKTITGTLDGKKLTIKDADIYEVVDAKKGTSRVRIEDVCSELTLVVKASAAEVERGGSVLGGVIGGVVGGDGAAPVEELRAASGTEVLYEDGTRAGELSRDWTLPRSRFSEKGDLWCRDHAVGESEKDQTLSLCFHREAVKIMKPASTPPPKEPPLSIPMAKLTRTGGTEILLPEWVRDAAIEKQIDKTNAAVRICLDTDGKPSRVDIVKRTPWPKFDDELKTTIMKTWRFAPHKVNGNVVPVCTAAVFSWRIE
jgi:hypothetical protein